MTEHHTDSSVDQQIEQLYRSLSTEQPPASLDRQILDAAHRAVEVKTLTGGSSSNIWLRSLAYAAVVVVGVSVVIEVSMQPEVMPTEPALLIEERKAPTVGNDMAVPGVSNSIQSSERVSGSNVGAQAQLQRTKKVEMKTRQKVQSVVTEPSSVPAPAPAAAEIHMFEMAAPDTQLMLQDELPMGAAPVQPWQVSPQLWIQYCQHLLAGNKSQELATELAEFKRQHGDFPLPENLSDWLKTNSSKSTNP